MSAWIIGFAAFAGALALTAVQAHPRWPLRVLDRPGNRSMHDAPTPTIGGAGTLAGLVLAGGLAVWMGVPLFWDPNVLAGLLLVAGVSLLDDIRNMPATLRLLVHTAGAFALLAGGYGLQTLALPGGWTLPLGPLGPLFTVLFIVWMTNLFNFMDGSDGMAGGMGVAGFGTLAGVAWLGGYDAFALSAALVALANLGFLTQNFPPARIFMGDVGSISMGYLAAAAALIGTRDGIFPLWLAVLAFLAFVVDATVTLLVRLARGEQVWRAHRFHYFQRLVLLGWGHRRTALTYYLLMAATGLTVLWLALANSRGWDVAGVVGWLLICGALALRVERQERGRLPLSWPFRAAWLPSRVLIFLHDLAWVPAAVYLAYAYRFSIHGLPEWTRPGMLWMGTITVPVYGAIFWYYGVYRGVWRTIAFSDLFRLLKALMLGLLVSSLLLFVLRRFDGIPRSVFVAFPILLGIGLVGPRALYRWLLEDAASIGGERVRALVVGAGWAGESLIERLRPGGRYLPVALVDPDPRVVGKEVQGLKVEDGLDRLDDLCRSHSIGAVLLAAPQLDSQQMGRLADACARLRMPLRMLDRQALTDVNRIDDAGLLPVTIEDVLWPVPEVFVGNEAARQLRSRRVLVTGGGGTIGSELCHQIAGLEPSSLIILDSSEIGLQAVKHALNLRHPQLAVEAVLGDICKPHDVEDLFRRFQPQVVFHAAALKNVALLEANPQQAVQVNILGTREVARAAVRHESERFLLISTDRAVHPTSVMGASKRVAELFCASLKGRSRTDFVVVRFGTVLGPVGSLTERFAGQIVRGGPVTVTQPEIERRFMSLRDAIALVLEAAAAAEGGDLLVLDMGAPLKIRELAEQMIRLAGQVPYTDIPIVFTGLRPGEKLSDEPARQGETLAPTAHPRLLAATPLQLDWGWLQQMLDEFQALVTRGEGAEMVAQLQRIVPEFSPARFEPREQTQPPPRPRLRVVE
jgi:FlaA1/EpsC-like NDP-sugar epimerase/UDP-N-acetylmuramyl pentapeptide phosphotransferase/UDP-N-acetylglucosamine-1-phosphate transferase